jgi:hypothetical protein
MGAGCSRETPADILTGATFTGDIIAGAIPMGLEVKACGAERTCARSGCGITRPAKITAMASGRFITVV